MKLIDLLKDVKVEALFSHDLEKDILGIATDHRQVKKGDLFIAMKGENFDGDKFVDDAFKNGAAVVISENNHYVRNCVRVKDVRAAYSLISKHFYNDACDKLKIIAVTGTNGKTTTCNIIAEILKSSGKKVGVIGTMGAKLGNETIETGMTTPDPDALHAIFKKMVDNGEEYAVMEASAHALALKKLEGITFVAGVLTNITEDHLDFFGDMQSYAKAKFLLFKKGRVKNAIICEDKVYDENLLKMLEIPYISYGFGEKDGEDEAIYARNIESSFSGSRFSCNINGVDEIIRTPLVGLYNIENVLASIAVCNALGFSNRDIAKGIRNTLPVEGRFNVIKINGLNIIIDFAHTPDGLEKVLATTRELTDDKLVVIFGCGGNRDKLKRPIMGEIASRLADEVILTSDNPRFENPLEIIAEVKKGITKDNVVAIVDRKKAIEYALSKYNNGETIVIAGKGGEKYQDIGGIKYPYNDFDVVNSFFRCQFLKKKASSPAIKKIEDDEFESEI